MHELYLLCTKQSAVFDPCYKISKGNQTKHPLLKWLLRNETTVKYNKLIAFNALVILC